MLAPQCCLTMLILKILVGLWSCFDCERVVKHFPFISFDVCVCAVVLGGKARVLESTGNMREEWPIVGCLRQSLMGKTFPVEHYEG